jgi:hypothetical protein
VKGKVIASGVIDKIIRSSDVKIRWFEMVL